MPKKSKPKTAEEAANRFEGQVNDALQDMHHAVHEIDEKKTVFNATLNSVQQLHSAIVRDRKLTNYNQSKLKNKYKKALEDAEEEAEAIRHCLDNIHRIRKLKAEQRVAMRQFTAAPGPSHHNNKPASAPLRRGALMVMLQQTANTMPLWIGTLGEAPPPLCGAIPAQAEHISAVGDAVAVLVKGHENEHNWILAEVISFTSGTSNKYEVEDVDEEQKERYTIARRRVIPLAQYRACPSTDPDALFPVDSVVLALYPQTTCFYKGVVEQRPQHATADYLIVFDDATFPNGYSPPLPVPQRYVVAHKHVPVPAAKQ